MSSTNPYDVSPGAVGYEPVVRRVSIRPFQLLQRGYAFLGDQYWLFVGICLVSLLLGSLVPMGLITGALTVGVFLGLLDHEAGRRVDFSVMFKGFDFFVDSLLIIVAVIVAAMVVLLPVMVIMMVLMFGGIATVGNQQNPSGLVVLLPLLIMGVFMVAIMAASILIYLPFVFCFQLIADQKMKAADALRLGWQGAYQNFGGIFLLLIVQTFIGLLTSLLCYLPAILFIPIVFSSYFLLYREVFPGFAPPPVAPLAPSAR